MLWTSNVVVLLYIVLIFSCSFHFRYSQRPKYYWNLRVGRSCEPLLQIKACWGLLLIPWVFPLPIHVPWHLPSPYLRLSLKYLGLFLTHSFLMHWEFPSPYMYLFKLCADILGFLSLYRRLSPAAHTVGFSSYCSFSSQTICSFYVLCRHYFCLWADRNRQDIHHGRYTLIYIDLMMKKDDIKARYIV